MLQGWEDMYKKTQLSLWILVGIYNGKGYADQIQSFLAREADLMPEDQSLYRSLRRLESSTLIESKRVPSKNGPDKKQFVLTPEGDHVLRAFVKRNIDDIIIKNHQKGLLP